MTRWRSTEVQQNWIFHIHDAQTTVARVTQHCHMCDRSLILTFTRPTFEQHSVGYNATRFAQYLLTFFLRSLWKVCVNDLLVDFSQKLQLEHKNITSTLVFIWSWKVYCYDVIPTLKKVNNCHYGLISAAKFLVNLHFKFIIVSKQLCQCHNVLCGHWKYTSLIKLTQALIWYFHFLSYIFSTSAHTSCYTIMQCNMAGVEGQVSQFCQPVLFTMHTLLNSHGTAFMIRIPLSLEFH